MQASHLNHRNVFPQLVDQFHSDARQRSRARLLQKGVPVFLERWHWFQYHLCRQLPTSFGRSLIDACIGLDVIKSGCGLQVLKEIGRIGGRDRNVHDYDQILQKMAEVLVINALLAVDWPTIPSFQLEERASGSPRGVDSVVSTFDHKYGFEIKAPALLEHRGARATNKLQVPGRTTPRDHLEVLAADLGISGVTLPRDNPVYDFLVSANSKFEGFKAQGAFTGILAIVWDDFIYEPITSLLHERCGLLTEKSYKQVGDHAETYPFIDAVILVRHLTYFTTAAAEQPLPDSRHHAFHIGGEGALPNVVIPLRPKVEIPEYILRGLWAWPLSDPWLQRAGDYHPSDLVWWHDSASPKTV